MKLIIGLGNPDLKHKDTRHNVGHIIADSLDKLPKGILAKKTDVYMNDSGKAVKSLLDKSQIKPNDLYIIHDDLDIAFGQFKIQFGRGPKQHNGIKSVEEVLHTNEFWRIRVGVENRGDLQNRTPGEEYVLQKFTQEELEALPAVIKEIRARLDSLK